MSAKMGRPVSDNPRKNPVGCKITDEALQRLDEYCKVNNVKKSDVVRAGLEPIINPNSETR